MTAFLKFVNEYVRHAGLSLSLILLNFVALIYPFISQAPARKNAIDALNGAYINRLTGLPRDPWPETLIGLLLLPSAYIATNLIATGVARLKSWPFSAAFNLAICAAICVIGTVIFAIDSITSFLAHTAYADYHFPCCYFLPMPLFIALMLGVFAINMLQMVKANRDSNNMNTSGSNKEVVGSSRP